MAFQKFGGKEFPSDQNEKNREKMPIMSENSCSNGLVYDPNVLYLFAILVISQTGFKTMYLVSS